MNNQANSDIFYDCIIVGGGATGAGIARDLSLRGLKIILLEKNDLSEGTTGRCHAMLHSGGRYVYKDSEAATECAQENEILLKIAPHITEKCGGYFIGLNEEDVEYGDIFQKSCIKSKVWCEELDPKELLKIEKNLNPNIKRSFKVNDGYIDPFLLTIYNALDAKKNGAEIKTYNEVRKLIIKGKEITGVSYFDKLRGKTFDIFGKMIINATGPWASFLEKDLILKNPLQIAPTMGTLLVIKDRLVNSLINRLRIPGDGDIFVPSHQSVLLGTTSKRVNYEDLDNLHTNKEEIEYILNLGEEMIPSVRNHRLIRFYSGARPLIASGGPLRELSRKFDVLDYNDEGYEGLITIFGGKLTTYRLMAEKTSDMVCKKLGINKKCQTSILPLPGGDRKVSKKEIQEKLNINDKTAFDMSYKWGTFYTELEDLCTACLDSYSDSISSRTICECENVTESEIKWANQNLFVNKLIDYRRRTRQGMGPCQGQFCYFKVGNLETQLSNKAHSKIITEMKEALLERWKTEPYGDEYLKRQIKLSKYMYLMGGNIE